MRQILKNMFFHLLEALAIIILVIIMIFSGLILYLSKNSIESDYIKQHAESYIAKAFKANQAKIEHLQIIWSTEKKNFLISAENINVYDEQHHILSKTSKIDVDLSIEALLFGKIRVSRLYIIGGEYSVLRDANGNVLLAFGRPEIQIEEKLKQSHQTQSKNLKKEWYKEIFNVLEEHTKNDWLAYLKSIEFKNTDLYIEDKSLTYRQKFVSADFSYTHSSKNVSVHLKTNILNQFSKSDTPIILKANYDLKREEITIQTNIKNFDFRHQIPKFEQFHLINRIHAQTDLQFFIRLQKSGIKYLTSKIHINKGKYQEEDFEEAFDNINLKIEYTAKNDQVNIQEFNLNSQKISFESKGNLSLNLKNKRILMVYSFDRFNVNFPKLFEDRIVLGQVQLNANLNLVDYSLDIKTLLVSLFNLKGRFSGKLTFPKTALKQAMIRPDILLEGHISGYTNKDQIMSVWPNFLEPKAKKWVNQSIKEVLVEGNYLYLNIDQKDWKRNFLNHEDLSLKFKYQYANAEIMESLPFIREARGEAELTGDSFHLQMQEGQIGKMTLYKGQISLDNLTRKGIAKLTAQMRGPVQEFLLKLSKENLGFFDLSTTPFLKQANGQTEFSLLLNWFMRYDFNPESLKYKAHGKIKEFKFSPVKDIYSFENGIIDFYVDNNVFNISGKGDVDSVPLIFSYQGFYERKPGIFILNMPVNQSLLDAAGIGLRKYAGGEAYMKIEAYGAGIKPDKAHIFVDLTNCDVHTQFWQKKTGEKASLEFDWNSMPDGYLIRNIHIRDQLSQIAGEITLGKAGQLIKADFPILKSEGFSDIKLNIKDINPGYQINIEGGYLNIAGMSEFLLSSLKDKKKTAPSFSLNANLEEVLFKEKKIFSDFQLYINTKKGDLKTLSLNARQKNHESSFNIAPAENGKQEIKGSLVDIGSILSGFLDIHSIEEGTLEVKGGMDPKNYDLKEVQLHIHNFKLKKAPFLAQLLSVASLKGLSDTLNGEGIAFNLLEASLKFSEGNKVYFENARVFGPAMGMTATGLIDMGENRLDIQGTLIPSYGVNSFLGEIPVLGDLLTSRKGEGVFGLTYTMKGELEEVQIFINPLSVLTPGIFRRIFEGERVILKERKTEEQE